MKKRIFGILLMGAMVVASMSMFTSCKDYDDDINSVKNDVTALRTELASLKTTLANDLSTAKSQLQTAIDAKASAADLTALAGRVATLETKIQAIDNCASKSDVTTLATTLATLTGDVTALQNALAAKANSTDLEKYALDANLQAAIANIELQQQAIAALQTKVQELQTALAAKGNVEAVTALQNSLNTLTTQLGEEKTKLATATSNISSLQTSMNNLSTDVEKVLADINILTVLVNKHLTSLVFRPELYEDGIEKVELVGFIHPYTYTIGSWGEGTKDEWWNDGKRLTDASLYPSTTVYYHFNPATADLDGYKASFYTNLATTRSKAGFTIKPVDENLSNKNKTKELGILKIAIDNNATTFNNINEATKGVFIALQAAKGDTLVNSDYAQIETVSYYDLYIADKKVGAEKHDYAPKTYDLVRTPKDAIAFTAAQAHPIKYDTTNVDLKQYLETHYAKTGGKHGLCAASVLEELGLSYKFKTISYVRQQWADNTDESIHIKVTEDGLATPQEVDATGKVIGDNKKRGAIGREPVVRVTLEDASGRIYAYGYIKLVISEDVERPAVNVGVTFNGQVAMNCDNTKPFTLTWAQVEAQILNEANISHADLYNAVAAAADKNDFVQYVKKADGTYVTVEDNNTAVLQTVLAKWKKDTETLELAEWEINNAIIADFYDNGGVGLIYAVDYPEIVNKGSKTAPAKMAKTPVYKVKNNYWGKIAAILPNDRTDARTTLFSWTIDKYSQEALNNYVAGFVDENGESAKPLTTYIKISGNPDLYVELTIPVKGMKFATVALAGSTLNKYWYAADATVKTLGADRELRASVITPKSAGAKDDAAITDFKFNILSTFVGGKISVNAGDDFDSFGTAATNANFVFVAPSNATADWAVATKFGLWAYPYVWTVKGVSGSTYTLAIHGAQIVIVKKVDAYTKYKPAENYTFDWVNEIPVVSLSGDHNALATYNVDSYMALDILNNAAHDKLKADETFAAYLKIQITDADAYCYTPKIGGTEMFALRFLRPIDATSGKEQQATDAKDGYQTVELFYANTPANNMIQLADWRGSNYNFFNPATNVGYLKYYGVELKLAMEEATSDLSLDQGATVTNPSTLGLLKDQLGDMFVTTKAQVEEKIAANKPYFYLATQYTTKRKIDKINKSTADKTKGEITGVTYTWDTFADELDDDAKITYVPAVEYKLSEDKKSLVVDGNDAYFTNAPVVTYRNNTGNVDDFYIYVPVDVIYTYGMVNGGHSYTQRVYGKIHVVKTEGTARAK